MDFALTIYSIGRFAPTLLVFALSVYLFLRSRNDSGTFWFAIYFGFLTIFNIGYFIGYSINNTMGGLGWYLACFFTFASAARIQISFTFPVKIFEKQRLMILGISLTLCIFAFIEYVVGAGFVYELRFPVHSFGSSYRSLWVPLFGGLFYLTSLAVGFIRIISIYRMTLGKKNNREGLLSVWKSNSDFRISFALIFITICEVSLTVFYFLNLNRNISLTMLAELMNLGTLIIFCGYAFVYSSSASGRTGFITRLIGITLVFFLLIIHISGRFYQEREIQNYYDRQILNAKIQSLDKEEYQPSGEILIIESSLSKNILNNYILSAYLQSYSDGKFNFFKIAEMPFASVSFQIGDSTFIGIFDYNSYRKEIHSIIFPTIFTEISLTILIIFFFPLLFRANFITPLNHLLKDFSEITKQQSNLKPIPGANEILTLRSAFDQMATLIRNASKEMPEVSSQIEILDQIIQTEAQKVKIGNQTLVYRSQAVRKTLEEVQRASKYRYPILITGETGSGKELISRLIHESSDEAKGPYVAVNCATLPEPLWESEIFGHKKGSFTDAKTDRKGRVLEATGGSLFFDEIGEMPLSIQPKMLRLLQENVFVPLGSDITIPAECRFIFATNRNLEEMVSQKLFREDLLYRIRVFHIQLPALRERIEDIPHLIRYFVDRFAKEYEILAPEIDPHLMQMLVSYKWPGNIREMENAVIRAMALSPGTILNSKHFANLIESKLAADNAKPIVYPYDSSKKIAFDEEIRSYSRSMIESALRKCNGNVTKAADLLTMKRTTLRYQMKELGIFEIKNGN